MFFGEEDNDKKVGQDSQQKIKPIRIIEDETEGEGFDVGFMPGTASKPAAKKVNLLDLLSKEDRARAQIILDDLEAVKLGQNSRGDEYVNDLIESELPGFRSKPLSIQDIDSVIARLIKSEGIVESDFSGEIPIWSPAKNVKIPTYKPSVWLKIKALTSIKKSLSEGGFSLDSIWDTKAAPTGDPSKDSRYKARQFAAAFDSDRDGKLDPQEYAKFSAASTATEIRDLEKQGQFMGWLRNLEVSDIEEGISLDRVSGRNYYITPPEGMTANFVDGVTGKNVSIPLTSKISGQETPITDRLKSVGEVSYKAFTQVLSDSDQQQIRDLMSENSPEVNSVARTLQAKRAMRSLGYSEQKIDFLLSKKSGIEWVDTSSNEPQTAEEILASQSDAMLAKSGKILRSFSLTRMNVLESKAYDIASAAGQLNRFDEILKELVRVEDEALKRENARYHRALVSGDDYGNLATAGSHIVNIAGTVWDYLPLGATINFLSGLYNSYGSNDLPVDSTLLNELAENGASTEVRSFGKDSASYTSDLSKTEYNNRLEIASRYSQEEFNIFVQYKNLEAAWNYYKAKVLDTEDVELREQYRAMLEKARLELDKLAFTRTSVEANKGMFSQPLKPSEKLTARQVAEIVTTRIAVGKTSPYFQSNPGTYVRTAVETVATMGVATGVRFAGAGLVKFGQFAGTSSKINSFLPAAALISRGQKISQGFNGLRNGNIVMRTIYTGGKAVLSPVASSIIIGNLTIVLPRTNDSTDPFKTFWEGQVESTIGALLATASDPLIEALARRYRLRAISRGKSVGYGTGWKAGVLKTFGRGTVEFLGELAASGVINGEITMEEAVAMFPHVAGAEFIQNILPRAHRGLKRRYTKESPPDRLRISRPMFDADSGKVYVGVIDMDTGMKTFESLSPEDTDTFLSGKPVKVTNGSGGTLELKLENAVDITSDQANRFSRTLNSSFMDNYLTALFGHASQSMNKRDFAGQSLTISDDGEVQTMMELVNMAISGKLIDTQSGQQDTRTLSLLELLANNPEIEVNINEMRSGGDNLAGTMGQLIQKGYIQMSANGRLSITAEGEAAMTAMRAEVDNFGAEVEPLLEELERKKALGMDKDTLISEGYDGLDEEGANEFTEFLKPYPPAISPSQLASMSKSRKEALKAAIAAGAMTFDPDTGYVVASESSLTVDGVRFNFGDGISGRANYYTFKVGVSGTDTEPVLQEGQSVETTVEFERTLTDAGVVIPKDIIKEAADALGGVSDVTVTRDSGNNYTLTFTGTDGQQHTVTEVELQHAHLNGVDKGTDTGVLTGVSDVVTAMRAEQSSKGQQPSDSFSIEQINEFIAMAKRGAKYYRQANSSSPGTNVLVENPKAPFDLEKSTVPVLTRLANIFAFKGEDVREIVAAELGVNTNFSESELSSMNASLLNLGYTESDVKNIPNFSKKLLVDNNVEPDNRQSFERDREEEQQRLAREEARRQIPTLSQRAQELADIIFSPITNKTIISSKDYNEMSSDEQKVVKAAIKSGDLVLDRRSGVLVNRNFKGVSLDGDNLNFGSLNSSAYLVSEIGKALEQGDTESAEGLLRKLAYETGVDFTKDSLDSLREDAIAAYDTMKQQIESIKKASPGTESINLSQFEFTPSSKTKSQDLDGEALPSLSVEAIDLNEDEQEDGESRQAEPPTPPVRTRGRASKEEISKIADKDIRWRSSDNPSDLGDVVFLREKGGGQRGRMTYIRNAEGDYVNTRDSSDVRSEQELKNLITSREFEYGTVKNKSSLLSKESPIQQSQSRTLSTAEAISGTRGAGMMGALTLTRAEIAQNEQTFREGKGYITLTRGGSKVYYDKNDPNNVWGPASLLVSKFEADPSVPGALFVNSRLFNIIGKLDSPDDWTNSDWQSTLGIALETDSGAARQKEGGLQSKINQLINGEISIAGISEQDINELTRLRDYLDANQGTNPSIAITQLNPELMALFNSVQRGDLSAYRKFESAVRHEFIHKLVMDEIGRHLLNDSKFLRALETTLARNPAWHRLLETLANGRSGYAELARDYNFNDIIHEVLAHGSDVKSIASNLGIDPNSEQGNDFFSVYYDIIKSMETAFPEGTLTQEIVKYSDPEVSRRITELYEANRLEKYTGRPELGEEPYPRGGDIRTKISHILSKLGIKSAGRKPFVWEGSGAKSITIRREVSPVTGEFDGTLIFEVAREDGTFSSTDLMGRRSDVSLNLVDLSSDEEAASVARNRTSDEFVEWARENGYDGVFHSNPTLGGNKYHVEVFDTPGTREKISPSRTGLYSMDINDRDSGFFLSEQEYNSSKDNLAKGEGRVHITKGIVISASNKQFDRTAPPHFRRDPVDTKVFVVNPQMALLIHDILDQESSINNPDRINEVSNTLGVERTNKLLFAYHLAMMVALAKQTDSQVAKDWGPALADVIPLIEAITGKKFDQLLKDAAEMSGDQIIALSKVSDPVVTFQFSPDIDYDITRVTQFHELTHKLIDETLGPNLPGQLEKAGVNIFEDPEIKEFWDGPLAGSAYARLKNLPEEVGKHMFLHEIMAFGTDVGTTSSLGVDSPETASMFIKAYVQLVKAIAKAFGKTTAAKLTRYAERDFSSVLERISKDDETELREIGLARQSTDRPGGRGLYSRDDETAIVAVGKSGLQQATKDGQRGRVTVIEDRVTTKPDAILINGLDIDEADIPYEARFRLKQYLIRPYGGIDVFADYRDDVIENVKKDLESRMANLKEVADFISRRGPAARVTKTPLGDTIILTHYDNPYFGAVREDTSTGIITLRAPDKPFFSELDGIRVNSVEEGMSLLRQAKVKEMEMEYAELKLARDWMDREIEVSEYYAPSKPKAKEPEFEQSGREYYEASVREIQRQTESSRDRSAVESARERAAKAVTVTKMLRSLDSEFNYDSPDYSQSFEGILTGITMADLNDMTRRGAVLNHVYNKAVEPGAYYTALKLDPKFADINPRLAVEIARIMVDTMNSRRNDPKFKGKDLMSPEVFAEWAGPLIEMGLVTESVKSNPKAFIDYAYNLVKEGIEIPGYTTTKMVASRMASIEARFPLIPASVLESLSSMALNTSETEFDALMNYSSLKQLASLMDDPGAMTDVVISSILNNSGPLLPTLRHYGKLLDHKMNIQSKVPRGLYSTDMVIKNRQEMERIKKEYTRVESLPRDEGVSGEIKGRTVLINGKNWEDVEAPQQLKDYFKSIQKFDKPPTSTEDVRKDLEAKIKFWEGQKSFVGKDPENQWEIDSLNANIEAAREALKWLEENPITLQEVTVEDNDTRTYRKPGITAVPNVVDLGGIQVSGFSVVRDWGYSDESHKVSEAKRANNPETEQDRLDRQEKLSKMTPEEIEAAYPEYFRLFHPDMMKSYGNSIWSFMVTNLEMELRYRMINARFFEPNYSGMYNLAPSQEAVDYAINRVTEFHDVALAYVGTKFDPEVGGFATPWTSITPEAAAAQRESMAQAMGKKMWENYTQTEGQPDTGSETDKVKSKLLRGASDSSKGGSLKSVDSQPDMADVSVIDGFYDNLDAFLNGFNPKTMTPHGKKIQAKQKGKDWIRLLESAPGVTQENLEYTDIISWLEERANTSVTIDELRNYMAGARITTETRVLSGPDAIYEDYANEELVLPGETVGYMELVTTFRSLVAGRTKDQKFVIKEADLPEGYSLEYIPQHDQWAVVYVEPETGNKFVLTRGQDKYEALSRLTAATSNDSTIDYRDAHWQGIKNVVASTRLTIREDQNGESYPLLEEVQSDEHQAGIKQGYQERQTSAKLNDMIRKAMESFNNLMTKFADVAEVLNSPTAYQSQNRMARDFKISFDEYNALLDGTKSRIGKDEGPRLIRILERRFGPDFDRYSPEVLRFMFENAVYPFSGSLIPLTSLTGTQREILINKAERVYEMLKQYDALLKLIQKSDKTGPTTQNISDREGPVPDAPLKSNWITVALKRAISQIVSMGHTKLAWTTAKQQVERYASNLKQVVDRIDHTVEYYRKPTRQEDDAVFELKLKLSDAEDALEDDPFNPRLIGKVARIKAAITSAQNKWQKPTTKPGKDTVKVIKIKGSKEGVDSFDQMFNERGELIENSDALYDYITGQEGIGVGKPKYTIRSLFGGSISKQIMESKTPSGVIQGDDITIGGELYRYVYDETIPREIKRLFGKYGVVARKEVMDLGMPEVSDEDGTGLGITDPDSMAASNPSQEAADLAYRLDYGAETPRAELKVKVTTENGVITDLQEARDYLMTFAQEFKKEWTALAKERKVRPSQVPRADVIARLDPDIVPSWVETREVFPARDSEVWVIDIPEEMSTAVSKGQSLYSREVDSYNELVNNVGIQDTDNSDFSLDQLRSLPSAMLKPENVQPMMEKQFALISAFRTENDLATNRRLNEELKGRLIRAGYKVRPANGKYGGYAEESFFVYADKDNFVDLLDALALDYKQEAILFGQDGRFFFMNYKDNILEELDPAGLTVDETGNTRISNVDGSEVLLEGGKAVYFSFDIGKKIGQPRPFKIDQANLNQSIDTLNKFETEFADPSEMAELMFSGGITDDYGQALVANMLLPNGHVDPENRPLAIKDGNVVGEVYSRTDEDGEVVYEWVPFKTIGGKPNPAYRGGKPRRFDPDRKFSTRTRSNMYRVGEEIVGLDQLELTPARIQKAYKKKYPKASDAELEALILQSTLSKKQVADLAFDKISEFDSVTMLANGVKTFRHLALGRLYQKNFDRNNPDLVNQRPVKPFRSDFPNTAAGKLQFKTAQNEYRQKMAAIHINQIVRMGEAYLNSTWGSPDYTAFYFEGSEEWMAQTKKDFPTFNNEGGEILSRLFMAVTSANTSLSTNLGYVSRILAAMEYYYESGDLLPLTQVDIKTGEYIVSKKKGIPTKLGNHGTALTKFSMLLEGYVQVTENYEKSLEYQALKQSGKLQEVKAADILKNSEGKLSKDAQKAKFIKSPLLVKMQSETDKISGLFTYLSTTVTNNGVKTTFAKEIFGQKIGSFMGNMTGLTMKPTIDIWMQRWFALNEGDLYREENGKITYRDSTEISPDEYEYYSDMVIAASKRLAEMYPDKNITPAFVQSMIWSGIMTTYDKLGQQVASHYGIAQTSQKSRRSVKIDGALEVPGSKVGEIVRIVPDGLRKETAERENRNMVAASERERANTALSSRDSDALEAQQQILMNSDQALANMDPDAWIAVAERLVTHNKLAESEKKAIRMLAEAGKKDDLQTYVLSLSSQTIIELVVNTGRVWLLLGMKNIKKNLGGNTLRQLMDEISRIPASILEPVFIAMNKAIGGTNFDRATTSLLTNPIDTLRAYKEALSKGLTEGGKEFIEILRGDDLNVVFEHPSLFRQRTTGWKFLRPLEMIEQVGWRFQGAMDRPFNVSAFYRTLHELQTMRMKEEHKKGNKITFAEAEEYLTVADYELAEAYALAATFQKKNVVADKYYGMIDGLPPTWRALMQNINKFVKTPLNVVDYILDYTGIWQLAKLAHREYGTEDWVSWKSTVKKILDNPQDRKILSMAVSQGAIGTLMYFIGAAMAKAGMLLPFFDREEKKEGEQMEAKNTSWGEVIINGVSVDLTWLSPNLFYLVSGATAYKVDEDYSKKLDDLNIKLELAKESGDPASIERAQQELDKHRNSSPQQEKISRILKNFALQTPFLRQLDEIKTAYDQNRIISGLAEKWFSPGVFVPAIVKELARTKDQYDRVINDVSISEKFTEIVQANIPSIPGVRRVGKMMEDTGVPVMRQAGKVLQGREALPVKVDMFGRPIKIGYGLDATGAVRTNTDYLTTEMDRLNVSISKPTGATSVETNRLRKQKGELYTPYLQQVIDSEQYKNSDDRTKKRILEQTIRFVNNSDNLSKLDKNEQNHNLNLIANREYYRRELRTNPGQFSRDTVIRDKDTIRAFVSAGLPTSVTFNDVVEDIKKTQNFDQWINSKFNYEFSVNDRQPLADAQRNYAEFQADPQGYIIKLWARDKRAQESRDRNQDLRQKLFDEGKTKEEVEKELRKQSNRRGVETRRKLGNVKQITVTK